MRLFISISYLFIASMAYSQQEYPNVEGETLLEDDRVIVQRFVLEPGVWEGIHEHPEHQLVIVTNSTNELVYQFRGSDSIIIKPDDEPADTISAFWRPGPIVMGDQHQSGNTGNRPLEWIAITFKSDSIVTADPSVQPEASRDFRILE
jgi:predicted metal-dependent enzyme (double-stranded beta helix superfamily)